MHKLLRFSVLQFSVRRFSVRRFSVRRFLARRFSVQSGRKAAAVLGLTAALGACAVGPDYTSPPAPEDNGYATTAVELSPPNATEAKQRLETSDKISADWWSLFHSKQLDAVLQQAVADNRSLAAAKATLVQAQELVDQAAGQRYPQLNFAASSMRQRSNGAGSDVDFKGPTYNILSVGPTLSFALDPFGLLSRQVEQQEALADAQDYQLSAAYLSLTGNAVTQAIQIASIRAQIKAIEEIIAQDETNVKSVETLFNVQEATQIDVQSAQSQLATDRTQLPPLHQQLSQTRHALAVLIGKAPGAWAPPEFELEEFTLPDKLALSLPSELVHQRPDILVAEARLHAASAAIGVATAQLFPNITLTGGISQAANMAANLFTSTANIWNIAANLSAPIFNGGTLEAQRQAAKAAFEASLHTYEETVLEAFQQVADLLDALGHDAESVEYQRRALDSTAASVRLTQKSYAAGEAKLLEVLDAQRLYEQARLGYARAAAQRFSDTAQLFVAMGGGWQDWRNKDATPAFTEVSAAVDAKSAGAKAAGAVPAATEAAATPAAAPTAAEPKPVAPPLSPLTDGEP
jgi:NodT family efflux transporter outer membrane factor (OMF) lipoprotein